MRFQFSTIRLVVLSAIFVLGLVTWVAILNEQKEIAMVAVTGIVGALGKLAE
jgi:fluoride ion exporter CrcB/FEX